jgi:hypothetical protein
MRIADPDTDCTGTVVAMAEGIRLYAKNQRRQQTWLNSIEIGLVSGPSTKQRETMCALQLYEVSIICGIHASTR